MALSRNHRESFCMRIFINALSARLGGGQTYLLNLLKHVPQEDGLHVYVLVQPSFYLADLPPNVVRLEQASLENPIKRAVWEETRLVALLKQLKIDLFFSPGGLLPRSLPTSMLTAVTFQNMLPFDHVQRKKYPYGYRRLRDWLLERGLSSSMRRADLVIFISEFARDFIKHNLGSLQGQSVVVPHGISPSFRACLDTLLPRPNWLPQEDYFLYVSFVDHYKAQLEVVRGFNLYRQQGRKGKLFLVGPEYRPYGDLVRQEIANLGLTEWVIMVGNVPHDELPAAYQHARINLFASFTENCPNILLEMMASGRPALVSNRAPMTEFGGDAVDYFDPSEPEDFARHLAELMSDEVLQSRLASAAVKEVANYTWEHAAYLTWNAIAEINQSKRSK
ncbi:MAG: glycosyltransferase family 4 protein [Methylotenera sp.]